MVTVRCFPATAVLAFALVCCLGGSAWAQMGGICVDNVQIKNDGNVVFSKNFDDGNISDWTDLSDVSLFTVQQKPPSRSLWMNNHGKATAMAQHKLDLTPVGTTEFTAAVYIAPAEQQYEWRKDEVSTFSMALDYRVTPNVGADSLRIDVMLYPKDLSCKVSALRNSSKVNKFKMTQQPVLPTGKWAYLTLRLDATAATATACLNGAPVASIPYDPEDFPKFTSLYLSASFGDGVLNREVGHIID
jgi:hypothetical protein